MIELQAPGPESKARNCTCENCTSDRIIHHGQIAMACSRCENHMAIWYRDNNASEELTYLCDECEDHMASKFGCAMLVSEGCGCDDPENCPCGCEGTGML